MIVYDNWKLVATAVACKKMRARENNKRNVKVAAVISANKAGILLRRKIYGKLEDLRPTNLVA